MAKFHATTSPEISRREIDNQARSRRIAAEGMVLLHNNGVLPMKLKDTKIALFGNGARHTIQGGTGSGEVNTRSAVNVEQGLKEAGAILEGQEWMDRFDAAELQARTDYVNRLRRLAQERGVSVFSLLFSEGYTAPVSVPVVQENLNRCEIAVYVIARISGEGADRRVRPGDYLLTEEEKENLRLLRAGYQRLVVVLNVGGVMDTAFLREEIGADAVVLMSQAGNIGGLALADILGGAVTPCGHLTTTWAKAYGDYACADQFSYLSGDVTDEYYREGVYVGYRWFDTFGIEPAYPFGFGLSYTDFSLNTESVCADAETVSVKVRVTNTGSHAGREVVQVYVSAPEGKLEKPYQELAAYAKTKLLAPDECETMTIAFPVSQMASYDEERAAWVLEQGDYAIRVGEHSRKTKIVGIVRLDGEAVIEQLKHVAPLDCDMETVSRAGAVPYTYAGEREELAAAPVMTIKAGEVPTRKAAYAGKPAVLPSSERMEKLTMEDVRMGRCTLDELVAQLTVAEMAELCVGTARGWGQSIVGAASRSCPGAAGDTSPVLMEERDVRNMVLADGPAGLRLCPEFKVAPDGRVVEESSAISSGVAALLMQGEEKKDLPEGTITCYQYCTAIPIATLLAQTWDLEAIEEAGDIVGGEMEELGATLWLAPGMNIHRNPLCGRNFEYYSEDPLVAGLCAAADTLGVQKHPGVGTTIKHYACNNLEDNRMFSNSHVTERALREIFLRGFEIAVKASQPMSIMTSYNLLNGTHTANRFDLINEVARDEWGFAGCVMTDWCTTTPGDKDSKYLCSDPAGCIGAGNDLIMPGSQEDVDSIVRSVDAGKQEVRCPITLGDLQACARRILSIIAQCHAYEGATPYACPRGGLEAYVRVQR